MARQPIDQIINIEAIEKQFDTLNRNLEVSIKKITELQDIASKLNGEFQKGTGLREVTESHKKLAQVQKESADEAEKLSQLEKKIAAEREKLTKAISDQEKELIKLKQAAKDKARQTELEVKAENELLTIYQRKDAQLKIARQRYNEMVQSGKGAEAEAVALKQQIDALDSELKELDGNVGQYQRNVGGYKTEMRALAKELLKMRMEGKQDSAEYKERSERLAHIKDTMSDVAEETKLLASDTRKLDQVVGVVKAFGAAYQVVGGTMQALGIENDAVERGIQKLVAVQSVLNGLTEIQNALQKQSAFMHAVNAVRIKVVTAAQWLWNAAMSANPIGLIITGIALLGTALGGLAMAFGSSKKDAKSLADELEGLNNQIERNNQALEDKVKILQAQGRSDIDILKEKIRMIHENYTLEMQISEKLMALGDERTDEQEKQLKQSKENVKKYFNDLHDLKIDLQAEEIESDRRAKEEKERLAKEEFEKRKKINQQASIDRMEKAIQGKAKDEEIFKELFNLYKSKHEAEIRSINEQQQAENGLAKGTKKRYEENKKLIDEQIKAQEQAAAAAAKMQDELGKLQQEGISAITELANNAFDKKLQQYDMELQKLDEKKTKELDNDRLTLEQRASIEAKYAAKQKEIEAERRATAIKQAKFNKAISVMEVIENTAKGIMAIWADMTIPTTTKPIFTSIESAIGAAQLAVIMAQPIPKYAKGRKGGKHELAIVGEEGIELINYQGKSYLTPDKPTLTELPAGANVIPNDELLKVAISEGFNELHKDSRQDKLVKALKDMKQVNVNVDANGVHVWSRQGNDVINYIDKKIRC